MTIHYSLSIFHHQAEKFIPQAHHYKRLFRTGSF